MKGTSAINSQSFTGWYITDTVVSAQMGVISECKRPNSSNDVYEAEQML